jgi:hypothetical protein
VTPGQYPLSLYRGDTYRWQFKLWADADRTQPADLTGVEAKAQIRDRPGGAIIVGLICTISLPNIIDVVLNAGLSVTLPQVCVWDLQLTYASGDVNTVLAGPVAVTPDVTDSDAPAPAPQAAAVAVPFTQRLARRGT